MRLAAATSALCLVFAPSVGGQTCSGVSGPFTLTDITGACTYETLLYEYTRQVFDATGSTCSAGSTVDAKDDLDGKLMKATGAASGPDGARIVCRAMYDGAHVTPFTKAANRGDDYHFEQMFYNGRSDWQEEIETIYETDDGSATSVLQEDAAKVKEFYRGEGSYSRVEWPNMLTNFDDATCASKAAMCCWPKDRQANDGNGNCNDPYDENCVDKDPADNTNLCFADFEKGGRSTGLDSASGFAVFPEDNGDGEGAIHCHGFAWADDDYDSISRYKANNLFFVSMYDHMHQRGYVGTIPGMPMCGCMEQMPVATRSDCTQVDLEEDWRMDYDGEKFTGHLEKVEIDFNSCRGRNGRNNDLWAYAARLYDEGRMTRQQFGAVGRVLTDDHDCYHATEYEKAKKGYIVGYRHNETMWTKVAGRDDMKTSEPYGREAFNKALFEQSLTGPSSLDPEELAGGQFAIGENPIIMRICPDCTDTHRRIFYRRLTPLEDEHFDLLHYILYEEGEDSNNVWGEDFTLHSSYEEARSGDNPWKCPNDSFNYDKQFTGNCSPDGTKESNQHSRWDSYPGPRPNVAYYVNKPEADGVQDYVDNDGVTRSVGLTDVDIGDPGMEGNTMEHDGVYHVTGSGWGVEGHSDQFHYMSRPWEGDVDVRVHLTDFANNGGDEWAKAGLMLRSDNSPDATYAFALLSGSRGVCVQWRRSKGNKYGHTGCHNTSPYLRSTWLRLVKKMTTVEFYYSDDGEDWTLQSTDSFFFPDDKYRVGLAVTSDKNNYLSEATFEDYTIDAYHFPTSAPSVSSAPTPWQPIVEIGPHTRSGAFSDDGSVQRVTGSGTGVWGVSDDFFFYNRQVTNSHNMTVEMQIEHFDYNSYKFARGGVMIRDSNDPDAANAFVGVAGADQGAMFQSRRAAGEPTLQHRAVFTDWYSTAWVKLVKEGSLFTGYYKMEAGDEWIALGTTELELTGSTVQVGRAVTPGDDHVHASVTMKSSHYDVFY